MLYENDNYGRRQRDPNSVRCLRYYSGKAISYICQIEKDFDKKVMVKFTYEHCGLGDTEEVVTQTYDLACCKNARKMIEFLNR